MLEGILLKPNMILPGLDVPTPSPEEVAKYTVRTMLRSVPAAVPSESLPVSLTMEQKACFCAQRFPYRLHKLSTAERHGVHKRFVSLLYCGSSRGNAQGVNVAVPSEPPPVSLSSWRPFCLKMLVRKVITFTFFLVDDQVHSPNDARAKTCGHVQRVSAARFV
jgi:hypothetical protein